MTSDSTGHPGVVPNALAVVFVAVTDRGSTTLSNAMGSPKLTVGCNDLTSSPWGPYSSENPWLLRKRESEDEIAWMILLF